MTDRITALTDKERQALRLLASGHDAKSIARHLGLSVHTINERLRDARRKMATSSSREAARLLRDVEGPTPDYAPDSSPENLVHEEIGEAGAAQTAQPAAHQPAGHTLWPAPGWLTGGLAMFLAIAVLAVAALSAPEAATPANPTSTEAESAVVASARQWLALIDADNWNASWDATGKSFKALNTSAKWTEVSTSVRGQFGRIKSRELISADYVPAPPEGFWIIKFRAQYGNKANAIETLSLERNIDGWRVVGVFVE